MAFSFIETDALKIVIPSVPEFKGTKVCKVFVTAVIGGQKNENASVWIEKNGFQLKESLHQIVCSYDEHFVSFPMFVDAKENDVFELKFKGRLERSKFRLVIAN